MGDNEEALLQIAELIQQGVSLQNQYVCATFLVLVHKIPLLP